MIGAFRNLFRADIVILGPEQELKKIVNEHVLFHSFWMVSLEPSKEVGL